MNFFGPISKSKRTINHFKEGRTENKKKWLWKVDFDCKQIQKDYLICDLFHPAFLHDLTVITYFDLASSNSFSSSFGTSGALVKSTLHSIPFLSFDYIVSSFSPLSEKLLKWEFLICSDQSGPVAENIQEIKLFPPSSPSSSPSSSSSRKLKRKAFVNQFSFKDEDFPFISDIQYVGVNSQVEVFFAFPSFSPNSLSPPPSLPSPPLFSSWCLVSFSKACLHPYYSGSGDHVNTIMQSDLFLQFANLYGHLSSHLSLSERFGVASQTIQFLHFIEFSVPLLFCLVSICEATSLPPSSLSSSQLQLWGNNFLKLKVIVIQGDIIVSESSLYLVSSNKFLSLKSKI